MELKNLVRLGFSRKRCCVSSLFSLDARPWGRTSCPISIRACLMASLWSREASEAACLLCRVTWAVIQTPWTMCCRTVWFLRLEVPLVVCLICTLLSKAILGLRSNMICSALPTGHPSGGQTLKMSRVWSGLLVLKMTVGYLLPWGSLKSACILLCAAWIVFSPLGKQFLKSQVEQFESPLFMNDFMQCLISRFVTEALFCSRFIFLKKIVVVTFV